MTGKASTLTVMNCISRTVFERTTIGLNDIRYRNSYGFIHGNNGLMCRKYLSKDKNYSEKIPLIRLSEMYYILAESVSLKESVTYINKVRNARGISRNNNIEANDSYDEAARKEALNKEYQKDFFAEGQYVRFRNPVILTAGFGKTHIFLGFKFPEDHGGFYKGSFSLMLDKIALCAKLLHGTSDSDPADMVKIGKLRLRRDFFSGLISTVFDLLGDDIHKLLVKRLD